MRHTETKLTGVVTSGDELPEMVTTEDGYVMASSEVDFTESVIFGDRSGLDRFDPILMSDEDLAVLRVRVAELSGMTDTEIVESIRHTLEQVLFLEDMEGNLFLRSLGNKLSAVHPDARAIVRMWRHGGCDTFPDVRDILRSYDLHFHRQRLTSAEWYRQAKVIKPGRRRYVR